MLTVHDVTAKHRNLGGAWLRGGAQGGRAVRGRFRGSERGFGSRTET
jgi:hypothetical protein